MTAPKRTRSELKRESIINAALQAFTEAGIKDTSMDNIALLANVSKRTVYNHFASKEILVMFLIDKLWKESIFDIDITYCADTPFYEQLTTLLDAQVKLMSSQQYINLSRMAFNHFFYHQEALKEAVAKFNTQDSALKRWITAAALDKQLAIEPEQIDLVLTQIHSLLKGSAFWPQIMGYGELLKRDQQLQLIENTIELFLARYKK
jgi:TetR/AcrR family transcriptional regulator of autoinduction and epiphytic fitness